jgi:hypothetical protein
VKHRCGDPAPVLRMVLVSPLRRLLTPAGPQLRLGITDEEPAALLCTGCARRAGSPLAIAAAVLRFSVRWSDSAMFHVEHWRRTHATRSVVQHTCRRISSVDNSVDNSRSSARLIGHPLPFRNERPATAGRRTLSARRGCLVSVVVSYGQYGSKFRVFPRFCRGLTSFEGVPSSSGNRRAS